MPPPPVPPPPQLHTHPLHPSSWGSFFCPEALVSTGRTHVWRHVSCASPLSNPSHKTITLVQMSNHTKMLGERHQVCALCSREATRGGTMVRKEHCGHHWPFFWMSDTTDAKPPQFSFPDCFSFCTNNRGLPSNIPKLQDTTNVPAHLGSCMCGHAWAHTHIHTAHKYGHSHQGGPFKKKSSAGPAHSMGIHRENGRRNAMFWQKQVDTGGKSNFWDPWAIAKPANLQ